MAPRTGFEPAACRLGGDRSIHLSYRGLFTCMRLICGFGEAFLLPLKGRSLYPTELRGHMRKAFKFKGRQDSKGLFFGKAATPPSEAFRTYKATVLFYPLFPRLSIPNVNTEVSKRTAKRRQRQKTGQSGSDVWNDSGISGVQNAYKPAKTARTA